MGTRQRQTGRRRGGSVVDGAVATAVPRARGEEDEAQSDEAGRMVTLVATSSSWNGDGVVLELRPRAELRVELEVDDSLRQKIEQGVKRVREDKGKRIGGVSGSGLCSPRRKQEKRRRTGRTPASKFSSLGAP